MRIIIFFVFLTIVACTPTPSSQIAEKYGLEEIEPLINGEHLSDTIVARQKSIEGEKTSSTIYYKSEELLINEMDIYIQYKEDTLYPIVINYYNQKFNSNKKDPIFNSWHTDSSEFNLYKKSDSSILVNIFKRTYL